MGIYFIIAFRNLMQAKRRTLLVSVAIGSVTSLLVLLMALSAGLTDSLVRSATMWIAGHVNIGGFYKSKPSDAHPMITRTDEVRRLVEQATPNLDYVIDRHRGWAKLVSESSQVQVALSGIDVEEERRFFDRVRLAPESTYREGGREQVVGTPDALAQTDTIMIFASQAKRLEVGVGDMLTVVTETISGTTNTGDVQVVAVAKDMGPITAWSAFTPKETVRSLYSLKSDTSGAIMVYLKDIEGAEPAMVALRQALQEQGYRLMDHQPAPFWRKFEIVAGEDWTGQKYDLTLWLDEAGAMKYTLDVLSSLSFMLLVVLLVIIVIGIMNTMWIAVRERTNEIGTLRAIGMQRANVLRMMLTEAFLLGLFATSVGAALGGVVAWLLDAAALELPSEAVRAFLLNDTLHLVLEPAQPVLAIGLFTAVTMAAALWPAIRAARLQPVTAIHHAA